MAKIQADREGTIDLHVYNENRREFQTERIPLRQIVITDELPPGIPLDIPPSLLAQIRTKITYSLTDGSRRTIYSSNDCASIRDTLMA